MVVAQGVMEGKGALEVDTGAVASLVGGVHVGTVAQEEVCKGAGIEVVTEPRKGLIMSRGEKKKRGMFNRLRDLADDPMMKRSSALQAGASGEPA